MGTSAVSEPLHFFIIVIYDRFSPWSFENGRIDHFTDLLNGLLNRYDTY